MTGCAAASVTFGFITGVRGEIVTTEGASEQFPPSADLQSVKSIRVCRKEVLVKLELANDYSPDGRIENLW